jgi:uncharacterized membrane protein YccC
MASDTREPRPSLGRRAVALLVLLIAGWILLKVVIGLIAGLATVIVIVVALVAIIWAWRIL